MRFKRMIALLLCTLLFAAAQAEAPDAKAPVSAERTEYAWTLKISRTAANGMPIQELLTALIAENCPAQLETHARTVHTSPKGADAWETSIYGEVVLIFPEMVQIVLPISPDDADTNAAYAILRDGADAVPLTDAAVSALPNWRITSMMLLSADSDDFAEIRLSGYEETILSGM